MVAPMIKIILSYLLCMSAPRSLAEAMNKAAVVDELDANVVKLAGVSDELQDRCFL